MSEKTILIALGLVFFVPLALIFWAHIYVMVRDILASGMPLREDPQGLRPQAGSPVGEAETPNG